MKLQEGENILFEGKPEKRIFAMWIFTKVLPVTLLISFITAHFTFMVIAIYFGAIKHFKEPPFFYLKPLLIFIVPLTLLLVFLYYKDLRKTFRYYITNQRCVFEGGIFIRRSRNVPYHKITDIEVNQNILERYLGLSSLKVFTPGTGSVGVPGLEKAEITFYGLKDADMPAAIVQQILKQYKATGE